MFRYFLVLFIFFFPISALPDVGTFPEALVGEWTQSTNKERGSISITITKRSQNSVRGILSLTGSSYCKDPIPFRGESSGDTAEIIGDAFVICGYTGTLRGRVVYINDDLFIGNFSYTWFGITWAEGTFHLTPKILEVKP